MSAVLVSSSASGTATYAYWARSQRTSYVGPAVFNANINPVVTMVIDGNAIPATTTATILVALGHVRRTGLAYSTHNSNDESGNVLSDQKMRGGISG